MDNIIKAELDGLTYPMLTELNEEGLRDLVENHAGEFNEHYTYVQKTSLRHFEEGLIVCVDLQQEGFDSGFFWMTTDQLKQWNELG